MRRALLLLAPMVVRLRHSFWTMGFRPTSAHHSFNRHSVRVLPQPSPKVRVLPMTGQLLLDVLHTPKNGISMLKGNCQPRWYCPLVTTEHRAISMGCRGG